jgi:hypothetical protein
MIRLGTADSAPTGRRGWAMSLSRRQQRLLEEINDAVGRSDPLLARKLAVFSQLAVGESMPRHEQLGTLASRLRAGAAAIVTLIARVGATMARATGAAVCWPAGHPPARPAAAPGTPGTGARGAPSSDQPGPARP